MDVFLAVPNTLMAITLVAPWDQLFNLILAMGILDAPNVPYRPLAVLSIIGQDYIEAAKACG